MNNDANVSSVNKKTILPKTWNEYFLLKIFSMKAKAHMAIVKSSTIFLL